MPTPSGHPAPALSVDVADLAWGPVTVRIAWTLLSMTVAPRAEILRDVRDHVWLHLDPDLSVSAAEDVAERLTRASSRGRAASSSMIPGRRTTTCRCRRAGGAG